MKKTDPPIIVSQYFAKPASEVWKAITELTQMKQWFFHQIPNFKAEVGFKVQFNVATPNRNFLHLWEIIEVIPEEKIVYNWKYKNFKGDSLVTFTLTPISNSETKLVLSTTILEDFDSTIEEFKYESGLAGWTYFIKQQLVSFLSQKK